MNESQQGQMSAWFTGPNAENGDQFLQMISRVFEDYTYWRRNYFPQDGIVLGSHERRDNEPFQDEFEDRLTELLARLKDDLPFYSPRYAGHMMSEQTLPSIAGLFAGILYNPNNVSVEAAPVTVDLELEVSCMISKMLGHDGRAWSHITSGGTVANFESLWLARTVRLLPFLIVDIAKQIGLENPLGTSDRDQLLNLNPQACLEAFERLDLAASGSASVGHERFVEAYQASHFSPADAGIAEAAAAAELDLVLLVPQTGHYCMPKALDLLGLGRRSLVQVPVDSDFRMDTAALRSILLDLDREGKTPLAVAAIMGSTECGAVDPVDQVLDIRAEREAAGLSSFWIHADAAYGGYLRTMVVPERIGLGAPTTRVMVAGGELDLDISLPDPGACNALERLGECDSIAVDPHKLGYVPYPAGAVSFKSNLVKPLARQEARYISEPSEGVAAERDDQSIGVYILEGSKPGAAAASLWLSHTLIPLDSTGHGVLMQETVRSAAELYTLLERWPELAGASTVQAVPLCPPGSNIVCFAFKAADPGVSLEKVNQMNRALYDRFSISPGATKSIHERPFFVSRTVIDPSHYSDETAGEFLGRLGVTREEYAESSVFLIRSVLMNPWYSQAKTRGRHFIAELVAELYSEAEQILESLCD